jgi:hypothetical protein
LTSSSTGFSTTPQLQSRVHHANQYPSNCGDLGRRRQAADRGESHDQARPSLRHPQITLRHGRIVVTIENIEAADEATIQDALTLGTCVVKVNNDLGDELDRLDEAIATIVPQLRHRSMADHLTEREFQSGNQVLKC